MPVSVLLPAQLDVSINGLREDSKKALQDAVRSKEGFVLLI